jgi:hypothetical protein
VANASDRALCDEIKDVVALPPGSHQVFDLVSTDGGRTFAAKTGVSETTGNAREPEIATNGTGAFYVVWTDDSTGNDDIVIRRLGSAAKVTPIRDKYRQSRPTILAADNDVYVAFEGVIPNGSAAHMAVSNNGGASFTVPTSRATPAGHWESMAQADTVANARLALQADRVLFAWEASTPTHIARTVAAKLFKRNGDLIRDAAGDAPRISSGWSPTAVGASYWQNASDPNFTRSLCPITGFREGKAFAAGSASYVVANGAQRTEIRVARENAPPGSSGMPGMVDAMETAVSGQTIGYVAQTTRDNVTDIWFSKDPYGFGKNLSNSPGRSTSPRIAATSAGYFVAWVEEASGSSDIYFAVEPAN